MKQKRWQLAGFRTLEILFLDIFFLILIALCKSTTVLSYSSIIMLDERNDNSEVYMYVYKYNTDIKIVLSEGLRKIQLIQTKLNFTTKWVKRIDVFTCLKAKIKNALFWW